METITILIPTYNVSNKLRKCLESVVNQTYKNLKVIILDDNSTDNTKEIVDLFRNKLDIEYFKNDVNLGRGASRNKILELSKTRLSCWLDSDDYIHPEKIEKQYNFFKSNGSCTFLATPMFDCISENEHRFGYSTYERIKGINLDNLKIINHIPHPTVMFITEIAKEIKFKNELIRNEDWDFYIRLYEKGYKVDVIPETLYYYVSY